MTLVMGSSRLHSWPPHGWEGQSYWGREARVELSSTGWCEAQVQSLAQQKGQGPDTVLPVPSGERPGQAGGDGPSEQA